MRRILIANPVKDSFPVHHEKAIIELLFNRPPNVDLGHMYSRTGGIHFARDQIADYAMKHGFDEVINWDIDLQPNLAMFHRLISHSEPDIVCGFYCRKDLRTHFNVQRIPGNQPDANGLEVVSRCAIGFSKIKTSVYRKIIEDTPERAYRLTNEGDKEPQLLHQLHPSELVGPNSATVISERIREIINRGYDREEAYERILDVFSKRHEPSDHLGEDYGFLRLAQQSGFKVHCDTQLLIPHGDIGFPVQTELLQECLLEPWRCVHVGTSIPELVEKHGRGPCFSIVKPGEPLWPADYIRPGLSPDHCRDVLEGSYDIPFNPEKPPVILDIGANIGAFARWAVQRWPGATVYCYEPAPENFELLMRTTSQLLNVGRNPFAVGNQNSFKKLANHGFNCGEYRIVADHDTHPSAGIVQVMDAQELPKADILKIDTEGQEYVILERLALADRLKELKAVMLEFHSDYDRVRITELLAAHGLSLIEENIHSQHRGELKFLRKASA